MEPDRYARMNEIFADALAVPPETRAAFVANACDGDHALRRKVEALLARASSEDDPDEPLSEPQLDAVREGLEHAFPSVGTATPAAALPETIGRYRIVRRIATGGMGVVYEAQQDSPRRRVALKLIPAHRATPDRLRRFRQESEVLGRLHHPGIAQIHEAGTFDLGEGAQPFFAMEYVDGVDARTHAERAGFDVRAKLDLVAAICDAVHYAHDKGVIHRDLKPDNVFIDEHDHVKVLDFGVARAGETSTAISTVVTHEGQIIGTLAYMAPEQLSADPEQVTPRADVYALGVMAFELLTGRLPHDLAGMPTTAAIHAMTDTDAPPLGRFDPAYRGDVETIVGTALDKEPSRRYASAAALAADIRRYLDHEPIAARPPSRTYRIRKFARRNRVLVGGTAATLVTLAVGMVVAVVLAAEARRNEATAQRNEIFMTAGVLRSAQVLLENGNVHHARRQHQLVPEPARGWAWRLLDLRMPHVLEHPRDITWEFMDDDHLVQESTERGGVRIYDIADRTTRIVFEGAGLERIGRSNAGGLTIGHRNGETLLLDLRNERIIERWAPDDPRQFGGISADGRVMVLKDAEGATLIADGKERRLANATLSSDGKLVVETTDSRVRVIDVDTWEVVYETTRENKETCRPHDGGFLLGRADRGLRRVDRTPDGLVFHEHEFNAPGEYVYTSRDGRVAVAMRWQVTNGAWVRDTATGAPITAGHELDENGFVPFTGSSSVRMAPGGTRILIHTNVAGGTWIVDCDPAAAEPGSDPRSRALRGHTSWIYHLAVSHDGSLVASAAPEDPLVRVWDARTGETVATLRRRCWTHGSWDAFMAFSSDDRRLVLTTPFDVDGAYGGIAVVDWNLAEGTVDAAWPESKRSTENHVPWLDDFIVQLDPAPRARVSSRAQMFGDTARIVWLPALFGFWHIPPGAQTGGRRWSLVPGSQEHGGGEWMCALSIHPTEPLIATVSAVAVAGDNARPMSDRGRLEVTNAVTGEVIENPELERQPWCVAYSPDGSRLAIGTDDGRVLIVETTHHTMQLDFDAHDQYVYSLAWLDDERLVTASGDETLRVWDPRPRRVREGEETRWRALRAEMAARTDLATAFETMTGDDRAAARIELMRRHPFDAAVTRSR